MANRAIHRKKRHSAPRISRVRLTTMLDELDAAHDAVTGAFQKFWVIPDGEIRKTLATTQRKIRRAVSVLKKAA